MPTLLSATDAIARVRTGPVEVTIGDGGFVVSRDGAELSVFPGGPDIEGLAGAVESVTVDRTDRHRVDVSGDLGWAEARLAVSFPERPGAVGYTLELDVAEPRTFAGGPELPVGTPTEYLEGRPGTDPAGGTGDLTQFGFVGNDELAATLVYVPDFTALGAYCETADATIHDTVAEPPGGLGFVAPEADLDRGTVTVAAATLAFEAGVPSPGDTVEYCRRFVDGLAAAATGPPPTRVDWPAVAERAHAALQHPSNRHEYDGVHHPGGVELVTVLSVVNPVRRYAERFDDPAATSLLADAEAAIEAYHDPEFTTAAGSEGIVANTPAPANLTLVDAWYFLWPLVQTAEYARETGSTAVTRMALDAADAAIDVGRALDYEFPMWLNVPELRGVGPVESDWAGHQYDCTAAYCYLMLQYHELTDKGRFLEEAERAGERLLSTGFEYTYELTTASLGPLALAWLADETGDERYLEGVAVPLAGVLRAVHLFEPDAGEFAGRRVYGLHSAMPVDGYRGNYYANALEEDATIEYLSRFLRRAFDDLEPATRGLVADILAAKGTALQDSLPESHDPERVATGVSPQAGRRVNPEWSLPLEPFGALGPAHDRLGEIGQTLYGAGVYATMANVQYHPLWGDSVLYTPTPAVLERPDDHTAIVRPLAEGAVRAMLLGEPAETVDVAVREAEGEAVPVEGEAGAYEFDLEGGRRYRLSREVPHRSIVAERLRAPDRVAAGDPLAVTVTVRNTGGRGGAYTVAVSVGAETLTERVTIPAGDTATVSVETDRSEPGEYGVRAVRQRRRVVVE